MSEGTALTRGRIGFSCSPTITTGWNSVSANRTDDIGGMNTDLEVDNTGKESEDTEDFEVNDAGARFGKTEDGDDADASLTKVEGLDDLVEDFGVRGENSCDDVGHLGDWH